MTIAFDPALRPRLSGPAAGEPPPLAPAEAGMDFATLLADRALLDVSARTMTAGMATAEMAAAGGAARETWTPRAMSAPVAVRFDEGPLFGRAFLQASLSTPAPSGGMAKAAGISQEEQARLVAGTDHATSAAKPAGAPRAPKAPADGPVLHDALDEMPNGDGTGQGAPAGDAASRGRAMIRQDTAPPGSLPFGMWPEIAQGGRAAALRGSIAEPKSPDRGQEESAAGERNRQFRARFVDRLGPVQIVVREDGARVQLIARVALASASAADLLERRLRKAVAEEGHGLCGLQINGEIRPARARG